MATDDPYVLAHHLAKNAITDSIRWLEAARNDLDAAKRELVKAQVRYERAKAELSRAQDELRVMELRHAERGI